MNTRQQFDIWEKVFLAAITGFAAREGFSSSAVVKQASLTADEALRAYLEKGENFTKQSTD